MYRDNLSGLTLVSTAAIKGASEYKVLCMCSAQFLFFFFSILSSLYVSFHESTGHPEESRPLMEVRNRMSGTPGSPFSISGDGERGERQNSRRNFEARNRKENGSIRTHRRDFSRGWAPSARWIILLTISVLATSGESETSFTSNPNARGQLRFLRNRH